MLEVPVDQSAVSRVSSDSHRRTSNFIDYSTTTPSASFENFRTCTILSCRLLSTFFCLLAVSGPIFFLVSGLEFSNGPGFDEDRSPWPASLMFFLVAFWFIFLIVGIQVCSKGHIALQDYSISDERQEQVYTFETTIYRTSLAWLLSFAILFVTALIVASSDTNMRSGLVLVGLIGTTLLALNATIIRGYRKGMSKYTRKLDEIPPTEVTTDTA